MMYQTKYSNYIYYEGIVKEEYVEIIRGYFSPVLHQTYIVGKHVFMVAEAHF